MRITCAGNTDVGVVRSGNEDSFLLNCAQGLFIVADGMGGHAAGEVASEMAVRIVAEELGSLRGLPEGDASARMRSAIRKANAAIFDRTLAEHDKRGMGTTTTVMVLFSRRFMIGQVGDSRAYLLRDGQLLYRGEHAPAGLWNDGPSTVLERIVVPQGPQALTVRLRDSGRKDGVDYEQEIRADLGASQNFVIEFRADAGFVYH